MWQFTPKPSHPSDVCVCVCHLGVGCAERRRCVQRIEVVVCCVVLRPGVAELVVVARLSAWLSLRSDSARWGSSLSLGLGLDIRPCVGRVIVEFYWEDDSSRTPRYRVCEVGRPVARVNAMATRRLWGRLPLPSRSRLRAAIM